MLSMAHPRTLRIPTEGTFAGNRVRAAWAAGSTRRRGDDVRNLLAPVFDEVSGSWRKSVVSFLFMGRLQAIVVGLPVICDWLMEI